MPRMTRTRRVGALIAAVVLAGSLTACTGGAPASVPQADGVDGDLSQDVQAQFAEKVEVARQATGSSAAIVGVWIPWAGQWVTASGTQSPAGGEVSTDLEVKAGPLTRSMTCDVLYALDQRDVLSVDDPITTWTNAIGADATVTLGQLCNSTSGLDSYNSDLVGRWINNPTRVWSANELVANGLGGDDAPTDPGTSFKDSDTGYVLLGIALERASGSSLSDLYSTYVFDPLGMNSSAFEPATVSNPLTGLYSKTSDGNVQCSEPVDVTDWSTTGANAAGGTVSTISDMSRYVRAVAQRALNYNSEERFSAPLPTSDKAPTWQTFTGGMYQAGTLYGQYGSYPGSIVASYADSETGLTVVVILNNSRGSAATARNLAWQLAALASKVPAVDGQTAPNVGYPWTAEDYDDDIRDAAVCPIG